MIKWRKYLKWRPFGDGIWIEKYCVPDGTPWRVCASIFYRYHIPNGMTAYIKRHFIDNLTVVSS